VVSVAIVSMKPAALPPEIARVAGLNEQTAFAGSPLQLRAIFPEYPADGLKANEYVAGLPADTVAEELPPGCCVMEKAGAVPVPLSATLCGEPAALSVMVIVAERAPATAGVNTTLSVQVLPAATVVPQLSVSAKLAASVPVTAIFNPFKLALPVFLTAIVCAAEETPTVCAVNVIVEDPMLTTGAAGGGGGAGAPMVNVSGPEVPPPLPGLTTVICAVPSVAVSDA
jgi:hypothetical protein